MTCLGVGEVLFAGDGHEADLHGREPQGEGAGVVLDEDAEEAFDRAEERAVHHDGLVHLAVFADVFELEARGEVEVELHGGELPQAAEDVDELDVDLGAVEGGFAGNGAVRDGLRRSSTCLSESIGARPSVRRSRCSPWALRGPRWRARP